MQVGTTSSAAVDPISGLGDIAQVCNGPLQLFQPTGHDLIWLELRTSFPRRLVTSWYSIVCVAGLRNVVSCRWSICRKCLHMPRISAVFEWHWEGWFLRYESAQVVTHQSWVLLSLAEGAWVIPRATLTKVSNCEIRGLRPPLHYSSHCELDFAILGSLILGVDKLSSKAQTIESLINLKLSIVWEV